MFCSNFNPRLCENNKPTTSTPSIDGNNAPNDTGLIVADPDIAGIGVSHLLIVINVSAGD
jgi:hypothetical protein